MATTIKTISAALKLVDAKKENLRKAFEDLQAHSSSLSSFTLTWSDLDSHFTSLQSSLEHNFKLLQSQQQPQFQPSNPPPNQPQSQAQPQPQPQPQPPPSSVPSVPARPQLKSLCEKIDGLGLRKYIVQRPKERAAIRAELPDAFRSSPDAAGTVLNAVEGLYVPDFCCVVLLEILMGIRVEIGAEVKERAKKLAAEWKGNVRVDGKTPMEAFGFLLLLATYGLADGFAMEDLIDFAVIVAKNHRAIKLCRMLGLRDRISDLILKLISAGKQHLAVKFIFEFEKTDKFPPVPLLEEYVKESRKLAQKIRKDGNNSLNSLNLATTKEVIALKSVIRCIEDYKLESEYPKEKLMKRIATLEKKEDRKCSAAAPLSKSKRQSKPQKLSGMKRPRTTSPDGPAVNPKTVAAASSTVLAFQQSHLQPAGLLPERPAPYQSSPAGPYGYPSEPHMPSGYFDNPTAYGGYDLPLQYHAPYYPQ